MTRGRRRLLTAGIVITILVLAAAIGVRFIDTDALVARALSEIEARTGYAVTVENSEVRLGWSGLYLRLAGVHVTAPESAREANVGSVDLQVPLGPLIRKQLEVRRLTVHGPLRYTQEGMPGVLEAGDLAANMAFTANRTSGGEGSATASLGDMRWTTGSGGFPLPETRLDARYTWNGEGTEAALPEITVRSGGLNLALHGAYHKDGEAWTGRLEGSAPSVALADLAPALPDSVRDRLREHEVSGKLALTRITIETPASGEAVTSGEVKLTELSFRAGPATTPWRVPEATATFTNPGPARVHGRLLSGEAPIDFDVTAEPRDNDLLDLAVKAEAGAAALGGFLPKDGKLVLDSGEASVDLDVLGRFPATMDALPNVTGTVTWSGFGGTFAGKPLHEASGRIVARGHRVEVERCGAVVGGSDLYLKGTVVDIAEPRLDFVLTSDRLNLDELSAPAEPPAGGAAAPPAGPPSLALIPVRGTVAVGTLITGGMELNGVDAFVDFGMEGLTAELRHAGLAEGTATGEVKAAYVPQRDAWGYHGRLETAGVKLGRLRPEGFSGFGVDGLLRSTIDFNGDYTLGASPWPGMTVQVDLGVQDGAIRNVPDLVRLGQQLNVAGVSAERWPFRDLAGLLKVERGNLVVDTLIVHQPGVEWTMAGRLGVGEGSGVKGTARLDPAQVRLPPQLAPFVAYLKEPDGRIPVDFALAGRLPDVQASLDWTALAQRAASRASDAQKQKILDSFKDAVKDDDRLEKLRKKLGGG